MKKIISLSLCGLILISVLGLSGCNRGLQKFTDTYFDYFDTVTSIIGYEKSQEDFSESCDKIKAKLEEYHRLYTIYSRYDNVNNLNSVNALSGGTHSPVTVDSKILDMLQFSKEMYAISGSKVNVAMGSVLSIWHKYRQIGSEDMSAASLPTMSELKKASEHTNIDDVILDFENSTVFLNDPQMTLDVGAVAKGYATEQIARWMAEEGMTGYLLNVGGNIRAVGKRQNGEKWQVGIENPDSSDESQPYIEYLELENMSLAVSGNYQRYYIVEGEKYHHIIDPDTLLPAKGFKSVAVLCEDAGMADALSTALFCMDYSEGLAIIESLKNTYALWVTDGGELLYSAGFKDFTRKN